MNLQGFSPLSLWIRIKVLFRNDCNKLNVHSLHARKECHTQNLYVGKSEQAIYMEPRIYYQSSECFEHSVGPKIKYRKLAMIKTVTCTMLQRLNAYWCMTVLKRTFLVFPFYGMPMFPSPVWVQWQSPRTELGNVMDTSTSSALSGAGGMLAVAFLVRASWEFFAYICTLWPARFSQGRGESSPKPPNISGAVNPFPSGIPRAGLRQSGQVEPSSALSGQGQPSHPWDPAQPNSCLDSIYLLTWLCSFQVHVATYGNRFVLQLFSWFIC